MTDMPIHLYINREYWKTDLADFDLMFRDTYRVVIDCPGLKTLEFLIRRIGFSSGANESGADVALFIGTLNDKSLGIINEKVKLK